LREQARAQWNLLKDPKDSLVNQETKDLLDPLDPKDLLDLMEDKDLVVLQDHLDPLDHQEEENLDLDQLDIQAYLVPLVLLVHLENRV